MEQKLLKILLGLQAVPSNLVESIQSAYHYIFSTEFNFNSISLHLVGMAVFYFSFFLERHAAPGSVTLQEEPCENTY